MPMKTSMKPLLAAVLFGLGACGASNVEYYQVAVETASNPVGSDCPGASGTTTLNGIDGVGTWAIYNAPANPGATTSQYLLDGAIPGQLLVGTLANGTYTFSSTVEVVDTLPNDTLTYTIVTTISLTPSGPPPNGTVSSSQTCNSGTDTNCGALQITAACGAASGVCGSATPVGSTDSKNFTCTSSGSLTATQISDVEAVHPVGACAPGTACTASSSGPGNGAGN
jgi:hypothetical protein